jgi:hypothetical protein
VITFAYNIAHYLRNMTQREKQWHAAASGALLAFYAGIRASGAMVCAFYRLSIVRQITLLKPDTLCFLNVKKVK